MNRGVLVLLMTIGLVGATVAGLVSEKVAYVAAFAVAPLVPWLAVTTPRVFMGLAVVGYTIAVPLPLPLPGHVTVFKLVFIVLSLGVATRVWRRGHLLRLPTGLLVGLACFGLYRLGRDIVAEEAGVTIASLTLVLAVSMSIYAAQVLDTEDDLVVFSRTLAAGALVFSLGFFVEVPPHVFATGVAKRALGLSGQSNTSGANAGRYLALSLATLLTARSIRWRLIALMGAVGSIYGLLVSASRGAGVMAVVALAVLALIVRRNARSRALAVIMAVALVAGAWALAPESTAERFSRTIEVSKTGQITEIHDSQRTDLAKIALRLIEERPLVGHGGWRFSRESARSMSGPMMPTHDVYLAFAVAYGIPVTLLWVSLLLSGIYLALRLTLRARGRMRVHWGVYAAIMMADAVQNLVTTEPFPPLTWTLVGLAHIHWRSSAGRARGPVGQGGGAALPEPRVHVPQPGGLRLPPNRR